MVEQETDFLKEIQNAAEKAGRQLSPQALAYLASLPPTVSASQVPIEGDLDTTGSSQEQWHKFFIDFAKFAARDLERRANTKAPISTSERK